MHDLLQRAGKTHVTANVAGRWAGKRRSAPFSVPTVPRRHLALTALAASAFAAGSSASAPAQSSLAGQRAAAQRLQSAVAAESRRIAATSAGLADAERRLGALDARVQRRTAQLRKAEIELVRTRIRLSNLERRSVQATSTLSANLVDSYKSGRPNVVDVVLNAHGFPDLLERLSFFRRVAHNNARILDVVRTTRKQVAVQESGLQTQRGRFSALAKTAIVDREHANVLRDALLNRQAEQLRSRAGTSSQLAAVRGKIRRVELAQAAAARQAASAVSATTAAPQPSAAPGDVSGAVAKVVAAANQIASTPYVWGGGHGGASGGYDCSGSVSYALAAAGLVSSPLDSTGFMSWGEAGPGQHITTYANPGHMFMVVDGRRYDTSALSGGGTRWTSASRSTAGFVARHPPGL